MDPKPGRHLDGEVHIVPHQGAELAHQPREVQRGRLGPRRTRAGVVECALTQPCRPLKGGEQALGALAHPRILTRLEPIRDQHGRGQEIADVVVQPRHRRAHRREPAPLGQEFADLAPHGGELALKQSDFIAPAAWRPLAYGRLGSRAEVGQLVGEALQRAHHQPMERQQQQHRHQGGQKQGKQQDAARIVHHRIPQRRLRHDHPQPGAGLHARRPPHLHQPHAAIPQGLQCRGDGLEPAGALQFHHLVHLCRRPQHQVATIAHHPDADGAHRAQERILAHGVDPGRRVQADGGDVGALDEIVEPHQPEAGDGGQIDQKLAEHEKAQHQQQDADGKAAADGGRYRARVHASPLSPPPVRHRCGPGQIGRWGASSARDREMG